MAESKPVAANPESRFRSRKFQLAAFFAGIGSAALFSGFVTGAEWLTLCGLVLGLYGGANVAQAMVNK